MCLYIHLFSRGKNIKYFLKNDSLWVVNFMAQFDSVEPKMFIGDACCKTSRRAKIMQ